MSAGRGRFLSIEGNEGVGKSTFLKGLAARLTAGGHTVVTTREPGGTPAADRIRTLFGDPPAGDALLAETEALLVSAARAQHVGRLVRPALERGDWVVTDRYHDSMRAYQGVLGGISTADVEALIAFSTKNLDPVLTFLLDCDVHVARSRLAARGASHPDSIKRFDDARVSVHAKLRSAFLALQKRFPERIMILDASKPAVDLIDEAMALLASRALV